MILTYPHRAGTVSFDETAKGIFPGGKPVGVIIHYSADATLAQTVASLTKESLGYHLIIERDGKVYQMASLNRSLWHAGRAVWNGLSPNLSFLAIAIVSWGLVIKRKDEFRSHSGLKIRFDEVSQRPNNIDGQVGYWHKATDPQIESLYKALHFFKDDLKINPDFICGHDECALPRGRKIDPGGVLPFSMSDLRKEISDGKTFKATVA